jgi:tetratricopeptide (TPR) repeat protein
VKHRPDKSKPGGKQKSKHAPGSNQAAAGASVAPMSPRRRWLFRLAAFALVPLLLFGGLELVLRLAGCGYPASFFEKYRAGGKEYLVNNENFSLRFFPQQLARFPSPVMFESQKPAQTYRIFILGESAARGEPEPAYGASRYLEVLLDQRHPGTHFEVVNLGITAINSHVILPIARDCAKASGDLWIIYMGNNEMVGPFGAATVFGAKAPPLRVVRLSLAIQETRTGQLLADLGAKLNGKKSNAAWDGMKMFLGNQLRADDPRKEVVYQNFERNLADIVRAGLDSGAKILLSTVAVNLKDCPPFASLTDSNLPAAERARFDKMYAEASEKQRQTNFIGAAQGFAEAAKLDPKYAELQYHWGECLLAATNFTAAREHFQLACDDDALPFRADSRVNSIIQKMAQQHAGDLVFVDASAALEKDLPPGVCGQETFFEHVHFNFDGNFRLGRVWAEQVEKMLPAGILRTARTNSWAAQESCDQLLGLTDWNRCAAMETIIDRLHRPPFTDQTDNARRRQSLRDEEMEFRRRIGPAVDTAKIFQAAIDQAPQDHFLREKFAAFLESAGDLRLAAAQWQSVQELLPHSCESFYQAGRLLSKLDQWDEAEAALTKAVSLRPRLAEGWYELGGIHLATGKFEPAFQNYNHARVLNPQNAVYYAFTGKALTKLNRHTEAIQFYRQAIQLQPDLWEAHFGLGDELGAASQFSEAETEYGQVTQLRPAIAVAHLDRGVMLARLGRFDEALREFQETLRLEPSNKQAQEYVNRVIGWRNQQHP